MVSNRPHKGMLISQIDENMFGGRFYCSRRGEINGTFTLQRLRWSDDSV